MPLVCGIILSQFNSVIVYKANTNMHNWFLSEQVPRPVLPNPRVIQARRIERKPCPASIIVSSTHQCHSARPTKRALNRFSFRTLIGFSPQGALELVYLATWRPSSSSSSSYLWLMNFAHYPSVCLRLTWLRSIKIKPYCSSHFPVLHSWSRNVLKTTFHVPTLQFRTTFSMTSRWHSVAALQ